MYCVLCATTSALAAPLATHAYRIFRAEKVETPTQIEDITVKWGKSIIYCVMEGDALLDRCLAPTRASMASVGT